MIRLSNLREYPRISVYLGVIGLVVQIFSAVLIYLFRGQEGSFMRGLMGSRGMVTAFIIMGHSSSNAFLLWLVATSIILIASFVSIVLLVRGRLDLVRIGSVSLVVLALLSATTTFGLILGAALMFASGVTGMLWAYRHTSHL